MAKLLECRSSTKIGQKKALISDFFQVSPESRIFLESKKNFIDQICRIIILEILQLSVDKKETFKLISFDHDCLKYVNRMVCLFFFRHITIFWSNLFNVLVNNKNS